MDEQNVYTTWATSTGNQTTTAVSGTANYNIDLASYVINMKKGELHPELFFKYIKKKFGVWEQMKINARLKKLEAAFNKAVDNGQEALGNKLIRELERETRETLIYAKGIKMFIEKEDLHKYKNKIRGGHISDTIFKEFTRIIPADVLKKKKKVEDVFDGFVIYHYWDEEAEKKLEKKQKITPEEKQKMRDPVLFGFVKESTRLYYIAEWIDDKCDLSFEEIVDVIGKDEEEITLSRTPKL